MVVYVEYAFAENVLIDGLLLYLALRCAKIRISRLRLSIAAALGGGEALLFPVLSLPYAAALIVKCLGGILIALISVSERRLKAYAVVCAFFFFFTFALGGTLTAVNALGVEYVPGLGYLFREVHVVVVVSVAIVFVIVCRTFLRNRQIRSLRRREQYRCVIDVCGGSEEFFAFADSGNLLEFRGRGVCVMSRDAAKIFLDGAKPTGYMQVSTVNGSRLSPVYECEKIAVFAQASSFIAEKYYFTIGEVSWRECKVILSAAIWEELHEDSEYHQEITGKDQKKKRRSLFERHRGAAPASVCGGRAGDAETTGGRGTER